MVVYNQTMNQDLGYRFYAPRYSHAPGYPRVDIKISASPTGRHFDPERIDLQIITPEGEIDSLRVTHPWNLHGEYPLVAGRVTLMDRFSQKVTLFTFGGKLQIESNASETICILTSSAPILEVGSANTIHSMLVEEIQIFLARRRAECSSDPSEYEKYLRTIEPMDLYTTCLEAIREKFAPYSHKEILHIREFYRFIKDEIQEVQNLSPVINTYKGHPGAPSRNAGRLRVLHRKHSRVAAPARLAAQFLFQN